MVNNDPKSWIFDLSMNSRNFELYRSLAKRREDDSSEHFTRTTSAN